MSKPKRDDGDINAGLKQVQRRCVANHVGSYFSSGTVAGCPAEIAAAGAPVIQLFGDKPYWSFGQKGEDWSCYTVLDSS